MMKRRQFSAEFKARVAREALKEGKTIAELSGQFGVHPNQISHWKRQLLDAAPEIFSRRPEQSRKEHDELTDRLYGQVGQLQVELDWLKKNLDLSVEQKRRALEPRHKKISVRRQCELLGLNRSTASYRFR